MVSPPRNRRPHRPNENCGLVRRLLQLLFTASLATTASAQVCADELQGALDSAHAPAQVATALARTALEAIEPALPVRGEASRRWQDRNAEWLDRHGFLPNDWDEEAGPSGESWAQLLTNLQTPYRVEPRLLSGRTDPATLLNETQAALQRVASTVRPLALVATVPGKEREIASASVIWNWTPWPRLLLFEPKVLAVPADGEIAEVLASLGTCAWRPRAYFKTDANTANGYYLGNERGRVRVLATNLGHSSALVPDDHEEAIFGFRSELLQGASVAAVGFEGAGPSTWQVMKFLTTAQTNIGAFDLPYYLAFP